MARKSRGAKRRLADVPRHPNGRINHRKSKANEAPPRPYRVYERRVRRSNPEASRILLIAAETPERKIFHLVSREALMRAIEAAEDPRRGYPLGVLWADGLLCPAPAGDETEAEKDGRAEEAELLDKAGRLYAAQHYMLWRWQGSPCQDAPSHLERTMSEHGIDVRPATELDPEEIEARGLRLKESLEGARRALLRTAPMGLALKAVDRICIDGFDGEIHPGPMAMLQRGLRTLREYYNVRVSKTRDRSTADPAPAREERAPGAASQRLRRPRLPVNLTSDLGLRPQPESIVASVAALLKRAEARPAGDKKAHGAHGS